MKQEQFSRWNIIPTIKERVIHYKSEITQIHFGSQENTISLGPNKYKNKTGESKQHSTTQ